MFPSNMEMVPKSGVDNAKDVGTRGNTWISRPKVGEIEYRFVRR